MHDLSTHYDSAWFFMCGKSWANGLTPYVDFTDSKGPLLWIIYALGYAVSPHSYIGVFWLSCMAWTATLFFAWRCAAMFLKNECAAFVAMLPVALVGLQPLVHNETRCEDFAMPFVAFIVYSLCSAASIRRWNWHVGMGVGVCIAATAFMKYNITLMLLPFVLLVWAMARRRCRVPFARLFWQGAVGAMVVSVPFIVFFLMKGNLSDFIAEYLLVTLRTTGDTGLVANTMHTILSPLGVYVLILFFATAYSMANMLPCHRKVALLCNALFIALCSINSRQYYFTIYSPFVVFVGIMAVGACKALQGRRAAWLSAFFAALFLITSNLYAYCFRHADIGDFFTQDNAIRRNFYTIESLVAQVPHARMVSFVGVNVGICSETLPACKYWATQTGATSGMMREQIEACTSGKADFAVLTKDCDEIINEIIKAGWHTYDFSKGPFEYILLSRHRLASERRCCRVTNMDVLLKRRPAFCKENKIKTIRQ